MKTTENKIVLVAIALVTIASLVIQTVKPEANLTGIIQAGMIALATAFGIKGFNQNGD